MSRIKTFINGGNLLSGDLDEIEDDYECAFSTYKEIGSWGNVTNTGSAAGLYVFTHSAKVFDTAATANSITDAIYLDPARYWSIAGTSGTNPRTVYYNVGLAISLPSSAGGGGLATSQAYTAGLYHVTSVGTSNVLTLAGSPITGSTVTQSNPPDPSLGAMTYSGDFVAPAAGHYVLGLSIVLSGGSVWFDVHAAARLQVRQV